MLLTAGNVVRCTRSGHTVGVMRASALASLLVDKMNSFPLMFPERTVAIRSIAG